jgi:hypothetical protein
MSHRLAALGWSLGLLMENFLMMKPKLEPIRSCGVSNVGSIPKRNDPAGVGSRRSDDCVQPSNVRCTASEFPIYHINRRGRQRQTGS